MGKGKNWSKEEITYLKRYWAKSPDPKEVARKLGRTYSAVRQKARLLGILRDEKYSAAWTPQMIKLMKKLYPNHSCEEIGRLIGKSARTVQSKGYTIGLRKDPEWLREQSKKGWYKKGQSPCNKGKKWDEFMSKEGQAASRRTAFKKGNIPPNHKPVGWERKTKDGYWEIKVAEPNVFKARHRILWEQHHGPIPKGVNIIFIDGNTDNIVIENLRAETLAEKFNRCCSIHTTLPPEIRELVQLKGALNRQLNKVNGTKPKRKKKRREETI